MGEKRFSLYYPVHPVIPRLHVSTCDKWRHGVRFNGSRLRGSCANHGRGADVLIRCRFFTFVAPLRCCV